LKGGDAPKLGRYPYVELAVCVTDFVVYTTCGFIGLAEGDE